MLANVYIFGLSNDMKLALQKNLGRPILYKSLGPSKKRRRFLKVFYKL